MKPLLFSTAILLSSMLLSCNNVSPDNRETSNKFDWKIAGSLPDQVANTPSVGLAGPVAGISNDRLLIGGGSNFSGGAPWEGGQKKYYKEVYVYKKEGDSLVLIKQQLSLPYNVAYSANGSTPEGILVAGGENENGALNNVLLLSWNESIQNIEIKTMPSLPQALSGGTIAVDDKIVYFAGGQNGDRVSDQLYALNLDDSERGWRTLPHMIKPAAYAVLYVQSDGKNKYLYLAGGRKANVGATSTLSADVYQFNLATNQWSQKTSLPYTLSAHTGVSFDNHTLLVFSGDKGETFHNTEVLLTEITKEKDPLKKQALIGAKNKLQAAHPGFSSLVLAYNTQTDQWQQTDSIPYPGQVTTTALRWGNTIVIPCGEIRAGVRTANIIIGKQKKTE